MFKVKVIAIGKSKERWLQEALADYEERLQGRLRFEWLLVEDDKALSSLCMKEARLIALDRLGEMWSSEELAKKWVAEARIAFVIGGPKGLPKAVLERASLRWSLSALTFPNQIVRLLLVEQLYRSIESEKGSPYHK